MVTLLAYDTHANCSDMPLAQCTMKTANKKNVASCNQKPAKIGQRVSEILLGGQYHKDRQTNPPPKTTYSECWGPKTCESVKAHRSNVFSKNSTSSSSIYFVVRGSKEQTLTTNFFYHKCSVVYCFVFIFFFSQDTANYVIHFFST